MSKSDKVEKLTVLPTKSQVLMRIPESSFLLYQDESQIRVSIATVLVHNGFDNDFEYPAVENSVYFRGALLHEPSSAKLSGLGTLDTAAAPLPRSACSDRSGHRVVVTTAIAEIVYH